jgi:hypothetical protein
MSVALLTLVLQACIPGNLAAHKAVKANGYMGNPTVITDDEVTPEGQRWNVPEAVVLGRTISNVAIDLGGEYEVRNLVVQADNDDSYWVDASTDGTNWRPLWRAGPAVGSGLRTRSGEVSPVATRYLRLRGEGGDGYYSVAELRAYCQRPSPWPPRTSWRPWITWDFEQRLSAARITLGFLGSAVMLALLWWRGRHLDALLAVCGVLGFAAFWNWGQFHGGRFAHIYEHYHYYVGAKYFRELSYTRLYECSAIAEAEEYTPERVARRRIRNLATNEIEPTAEVLAHPERCKEHFTPERWAEFRHDVRYYRDWLAGISVWERAEIDHGYNATPWWSLFGAAFAHLGPASDGMMLAEGLLDPLLLIVMWGFVVWAFGWRSAALGLIFWGVNHAARYFWTGGAYLRMDFLAALIIGLCCSKKNKPVAAGILLAWSALLRIFPGFVIGGVLLKWVYKLVQNRKTPIDRSSKRLVVAFFAMLIGGVVLSTAVWGTQAWPAFAANSKKHVSTPLTNNMGLKTAVIFSEPARAIHTRDQSLIDPFHVWKEARRNLFKKRLPLYGLLVLGAFVLVGWAGSRQDDTTALILGVGLIAVCAELTCYYYSFMIAYAFLWPRHKYVGALTAATALLTSLVPGMFWWEDDVSTANSVIFLAFIVVVSVLVGKSAAQPEPELAAAPVPVPSPPPEPRAPRKRRRGRR